MSYTHEFFEKEIIVADTIETYHINSHNDTCIFYIDANEVDRWLLKNRLEASGICGELVVISNGDEGLNTIHEYYQKHKKLPVAIIVDLQLPAMDGFKFISTIKKLPYYSQQNCKLILTSEDLVDEDLTKINELQIDHILLKPIDINALNKMLL